MTCPPEPIVQNNVWTCPIGTKAYSYNEFPEIQIRDRDWKLAYESINLAKAGDLNYARKQAERIQNTRVQERALGAIAAFEK